MTTVTVAAAALDAAISTLHTSLGAYVTACAAAQTAYRLANARSSHRLDNACQNARAVILADVFTANVLGTSVHTPVPPPLATQHAAD
jgi:hypothetical protein